jgi:hypothetical protein
MGGIYQNKHNQLGRYQIIYPQTEPQISSLTTPRADQMLPNAKVGAEAHAAGPRTNAAPKFPERASPGGHLDGRSQS